MFEEPLHLIPRHLRKEFEKMLGVHVEGDLCPVCRFRLREEFGGKYEEFPVCTVEFSKRSRIGIGVVPPVDPNNQDTSVLIGSEDISKLDLYSEGDPRVLELNGALNIGNRGIVEFIEVFKNEIEYLHCMITATQEKVVPSSTLTLSLSPIPTKRSGRSSSQITPTRRSSIVSSSSAWRTTYGYPRKLRYIRRSFVIRISAPTSRPTRWRSRPCSPFCRASSRPTSAIS
jgi:hypothetical protein